MRPGRIHDRRIPGPGSRRGGETTMSAVAVPSDADEALKMLESALGFLAAAASADMPAGTVAECLRALEWADAVEAAARGRLLAAFDARTGTWPTGSAPPGPGWSTRPGSPRARPANTRPSRRWPAAIRCCSPRWPRDTCSPGPSPCSWPGGPGPGGGDLRTRPQRYHDALAEAMRRLLASDLLPPRREDHPQPQPAAPAQLNYPPWTTGCFGFLAYRLSVTLIRPGVCHVLSRQAARRA